LSQIEFLTILQMAMTLILELAGPVLITGMIVGLVVGVFQSVTQIQEATLTFVPKILAGILTVMFMAPWMLDVYISAVNQIFSTFIIGGH